MVAPRRGGSWQEFLALSTWFNPLRAAAGIGMVWFVVVTSTAVKGSTSVVLHPRYLVAYIALAVVSIIILVARGRHLHALGTRGVGYERHD